MKYKFLAPVALYIPPIGALFQVGDLPSTACFLGFTLICSLCLYYDPPLHKLSRKLQRLIGLLTIVISSAALLSFTFTEAAYGQFYVAAETFVAQCFAQASAAVPITFNVLRLILLAYLGVSLIRAIQSFRNQEDWLSIALPPAVVVAIVTLGDILSNLIISGVNC